MEIRRTFLNDKEMGSLSQTDYRIRMGDITASYVEGLDFSLPPANKLTVERFFSGVCVLVEQVL